jgi:hypothetical protein
MHEKRVQQIPDIEEEIRSLKDLGLSPEERIIMFQLLAETASSPDERLRLLEAADVIAVDSILLGNDD